MTESKYEELVSTLTKAGVALRDVNGEYRSTYDIIKDVAAVWDNMSSMEQAAMTTAVAGTRMQNVWGSLVSQFKEASGAMDEMKNSAGELNSSYSTYLDSIEGRTGQLTASFQALSQTVLNSEVVKNGISFANNFVNALSTVITAGDGVVVKAVAIFAAFGAWITLMPKLITWLGTLASSTFFATLAEEGFAVALAKTQSVGIVGAITAIPKLILAIMGYVACAWQAKFATDAATVSAITFKEALETVNLNPTVAAITAIVVAIGALAYAAYSFSSAGYANRLKEDAEVLSETTDKIKTANNELATANSRINELLQKRTLTFVEQSELQRLQKTNKELERTLTIQTALQKALNAKVLSDFEKTMTAWSTYGTNTMGVGTSMTEQNVLDATMAEYQRYTDLLSKAKTESEEQYAKDGQTAMLTNLNSQITKLQEYKAALDSVDYDSLTEKQKEFYDLIEDYETKFVALTSTPAETLTSLFGGKKWSSLHDEVTKAVAEGKDLEDIYGGLGGKLNTDVDWQKLIARLQELTGLDYGQAKMLLQSYILEFDDLKETGEDAAESVSKEFETLKTQVTNLKNAYDKVSDAIEEFNTYGALSADTIKDLISLEPEYLNLLMDENGQLNLNSESYTTLYRAKLRDMLLSQVKTTLSNILEMEEEEAAAYALAKAYDTEAESLTALINAELKSAYISAAAKDVEQNTTAYTDAVKRYATTLPSLISLVNSAQVDAKKSTEVATDALEDQKDALEDLKDAWEDYKDELSDAKDEIQDLIDLVSDYIEQTKNDEKDALEERKDAFDDLIDKEKEELEVKKEAAEFEKTLKEKQNTVAKNALAASIASLDDSAAGKKVQKEANDNLIESRDDLYDELADHEYDIRVSALESLQETVDNYYDAEIKKIEDYLDDERQIYNDACSMIENDTGDLYDKLWAYTYKYTTKTKAEFDHLWSSAQTALEKYNVAQYGVIGVMNTLYTEFYKCEDAIDDLDDKIDDVSDAIEALSDKSINKLTTAISNLKAELIDLDDVDTTTTTTPTKTTTQSEAKKKYYWSDNQIEALKLYDWQLTYKGQTKHAFGNQQSALSLLMKLFGFDTRGGYYVRQNMFHYASGTTSARGGLSEVNEDGHEIRVLNKGDGILTSKITRNLSNLGSNPVQFLADAGKELLSKISGSTVLGNMIGRTPVLAAVGSSGDMPITIVNHINGDVNPSTLKALEKAQKQITNDAINGVFKKTLGLRNSSRVR